MANVIVPEGREDDNHPRLLTEAELLNLPTPQDLIDGVLAKKALVMFTGETGIGKTIVAMSLGGAVLTCEPFHGHKVLDGGSAIVVGREDLEGAMERWRRWKADAGLSDLSLDLTGWPKRAKFNLFTGEGLPTFISRAQAVEPRLILIDTLHVSSVGADENSAKDMGIVIERLSDIRHATGATVLFTHHTSKNGGYRGSSVLASNADAELRLDADGIDGDVILSCGKNRNGRKFDPIPLRLDRDALVFRLREASTGNRPGMDDGKKLQVYNILARLSHDGFVARKDWEAACKKEGISPRTFRWAKKALIESQFVVEDDDTFTIRRVA